MAQYNLPTDDLTVFARREARHQAPKGIEILSDNATFNRKPLDERQVIALERIATVLEQLVTP
jgi:hypothetical protein